MRILGHFLTNPVRFVAYSGLCQICEINSVSFSVFTKSLCQGVFINKHLSVTPQAIFYIRVLQRPKTCIALNRLVYEIITFKPKIKILESLEEYPKYEN